MVPARAKPWPELVANACRALVHFASPRTLMLGSPALPCPVSVCRADGHLWHEEQAAIPCASVLIASNPATSCAGADVPERQPAAELGISLARAVLVGFS